jgi:hypothetical protein
MHHLTYFFQRLFSTGWETDVNNPRDGYRKSRRHFKITLTIACADIQRQVPINSLLYVAVTHERVMHSTRCMH